MGHAGAIAYGASGAVAAAAGRGAAMAGVMECVAEDNQDYLKR